MSPEARPLGTGSVSIAMCTYNAEKFIQEQLGSFLTQTQLPAELVVQDDHSTDGTLKLVEDFAARAPFPVFIEQNATRLGPTGNFEKSMGRCRGDIVVLSDADDIWYPDRIEAALKLLANPKVGCVFSDADLVNGDASPRGITLWESIGFSPRDQAAVAEGRLTDALFRRTIGFGGTMTLRRAVVQAALPIPRPWGHDNWTATIAAALFEVAILPRGLMMYRQHRAQYSGAQARALWNRIRAARQPRQERDWVPRGSSFAELVLRLEKLKGTATSAERIERVLSDATAKAEHQQMREQLPANFLARVPPVLKDVLTLRYRRFSNGMLSALRDLTVGRY